MANIKLTKNEQKKQKDALKRFTRYLPTLMLKKQQLQLVIRGLEADVKAKQDERKVLEGEIQSWVDVFGEEVEFDKLVRIKYLETEEGNIAGVDIPVFKGIEFEQIEYDLFRQPLWVDAAVEKVSKLLACDEELKIIAKQLELLDAELRVTSQRVNLFEKVKIPETKTIIKKIGVYLGDQQTADVVRGKISKKKLVREA